MFLGASFPSMVELLPSKNSVSTLYMANSLGGAFAPLILGFLFTYFFFNFRSSSFYSFPTIFPRLLLLSWKKRFWQIALLFSILFVCGLPQWDPSYMTSGNYLYAQVQVSDKPFFARWKQLDYKEGLAESCNRG